MSRFVTFRFPDGLVEAVDVAAGERGRTRFVVRALEEALGEFNVQKPQIAAPVVAAVEREPVVTSESPRMSGFKVCSDKRDPCRMPLSTDKKRCRHGLELKPCG